MYNVKTDVVANASAILTHIYLSGVNLYSTIILRSGTNQKLYFIFTM